jgi:hypothetical protein
MEFLIFYFGEKCFEIFRFVLKSCTDGGIPMSECKIPELGTSATSSSISLFAT